MTAMTLNLDELRKRSEDVNTTEDTMTITDGSKSQTEAEETKAEMKQGTAVVEDKSEGAQVATSNGLTQTTSNEAKKNKAEAKGKGSKAEQNDEESVSKNQRLKNERTRKQAEAKTSKIIDGIRGWYSLKGKNFDLKDEQINEMVSAVRKELDEAEQFLRSKEEKVLSFRFNKDR